MGLSFPTRLADHMENKDKKREIQRRGRESDKEQAKIGKKIEEILESESWKEMQVRENQPSGNEQQADKRKEQNKSRNPLTPQKSANKKSRTRKHNDDNTYGGDYGLNS